MIKEMLNHLHYGLFAEGALIIFALVFVAVTVRTLLTSRRECESNANIVLSDQPQVPANER